MKTNSLCPSFPPCASLMGQVLFLSPVTSLSWGRLSEWSWYFKYGKTATLLVLPQSTSKLFKFDTFLSFRQIELTWVGEETRMTHICDTLSCSSRNTENREKKERELQRTFGAGQHRDCVWKPPNSIEHSTYSSQKATEESTEETQWVMSAMGIAHSNMMTVCSVDKIQLCRW